MIKVLASRWCWLLLAVVVAVTLVLGSSHPVAASRSARIAYLDGIIKCPVCEDVSIAESNAQQARNLRSKVAALVDSGASDAQVEQYVVGQFGSDELLRPTNPVIWILPIAGGTVAVVVLGVVLLRRRGASGGAVALAEDEELVAMARREAAT